MRRALLCLVLAALVPGSSAAYPIFVRAASSIELSMGRDGPSMVVRGRLVRDDASPISGARVDLVIGDRAVLPVVTDDEGRFAWSGEVPPGEVLVVAGWTGREDVDGIQERRGFFVGKSDVELDVAIPAQIDRSDAGVEIEVRARSDAGPSGLRIALNTRDARVAGQGVTDELGVARMTVAPRILGPPGPLVIEARSSADAMRSAGHVTSSTILVARSSLQLERPMPASVPADGELVLEGTLTDEERPIRDGAVEVLVAAAGEGDHRAQSPGPSARVVRTASGEDGRFIARVPFEGLPRGPVDVTVRYRPGAAWRSAAYFGPSSIRHLAPTPLPLWLALVPIAITALAVGAALRGAQARFRPTAARPARAWSLQTSGGLRMSRAASSGPRARSRPPDLEVTGRAWDPTQRRSVPCATVVVETGGTQLTLACDESGRFSTGPLGLGKARFEVTAPGYEPQRFNAAIPHHGELRDIRIDLIPIRHRVMEVYRGAALRHLPEHALWGFWTPRELIRFVRSRREHESARLGPLTDLFEEVYYGGRPVSMDQLVRARSLAG